MKKKINSKTNPKKNILKPNDSNNLIEKMESDIGINEKETTDLFKEEIKIINEIYRNYEINNSNKDIKNNEDMKLEDAFIKIILIDLTSKIKC